jgi:glucose/arabinose dehydrogenase
MGARYAAALRVPPAAGIVARPASPAPPPMPTTRPTRHTGARIVALAALAGCAERPATPAAPDPAPRAAPAAQSAPTAQLAGCDAENGGLTLPPGFCASVFAEGLGAARHVAVRPNGDVYVAVATTGTTAGGVVGLRDTDGDGRADRRVAFGSAGGNGVAFIGDRLYFAENGRIMRYTFQSSSALGPRTTGQVMVSGLPDRTEHVTKTIVPGRPGRMFVNVGSASNACQVRNRQRESPGIPDCPELATRAGVWSFDATIAGQTFSQLRRYATGLRNMVALAADSAGVLYGVQMNRDNLADNWPALYTQADDARLPAEELFRITSGGDYGWPYCYYDGDARRKVLAPEYGGDRVTQGRCATVGQPLLALPAHWAPISMLFYRGTAFPAEYRGGAFVAFHGDYFWGTRPGVTSARAPGYAVVFVPFQGGAPTGEWRVFADGFAGAAATSRLTAAARPTGLAVGADGALFVADDRSGRLWRISYVGL